MPSSLEDLVELVNAAFAADRGDPEKYLQEIQHLLVVACMEVSDRWVVFLKQHLTVQIAVFPRQLLCNGVQEQLNPWKPRNHHEKPIADKCRNVVTVIVNLLVLSGE